MQKFAKLVQKFAIGAKMHQPLSKSKIFIYSPLRRHQLRGKIYPSKINRKIFGVTVSRTQSGAERRCLACKFQLDPEFFSQILTKKEKISTSSEN
ncbi:MAG TPA: hypothetical protein PKE69_10740 [Pyrinomonadaceae bacterium]|nr:hypothetical protein [Pyrinomonadaceae bacterium]